ncbi:TetR/AcrR family transcriptional regulator [Plantactinospora soyae]|uniref:AcrR family transcriptional regulator n=1 Tax=Plantactinospora soyae TaxID=1544732 RepID=A0A927ME45_9ACTN|nr:TetR/AcrR family transcriptional regulator [Plantactinospora soyae]MBE1489415.1 AcrR family transcriptional regulator [Plantactinospora soyae]
MPSITRRRAPNPGRRAFVETEILAATRRLLINGANFTELGVQQISTEAGVARSTFYSHFRDKTDLLLRLATTVVDRSFDIASAWEPSDGLERLADGFRQVVGIYREHAVVLRAIAEVASYDATVRDFWYEGLSRFTDRTIAVLRDEQDSGRSPADLDLVSAGRVIVMGGKQAILDHITVGNSQHDAAFARELALIWWYGAYRRPAEPAPGRP